MVEPDQKVLETMRRGLRISQVFLAMMPTYIKRGHYPPEKLSALRQAVVIEARCIEAYRSGSTKGLSPVDRVWLEYIHGWAYMKIRQYADDPRQFNTYQDGFQELWDRRDRKLVALGLPPYGENYQSQKTK